MGMLVYGHKARFSSLLFSFLRSLTSGPTLAPTASEMQLEIKMRGADFGSTCKSRTSLNSPSTLFGKMGMSLINPMMKPPPVVTHSHSYLPDPKS